MTKSAVVDLAPRGVRASSVHPGPIDTAMLHIRREAEIAYMTGAELAIDGGASL